MGKNRSINSMETGKKRLVVVLGMHRSGTSAIARSLMVLGVQLGDRLMPPFEGNNEKGFWEDIDINSLNIEMLHHLNKNWHSLSSIRSEEFEILKKSGYLLKAIELIRLKTTGIPIFGFKDPRMSILLPFWNEVFRQGHFEVNYIIAVRHPLSVIKSLAKRDNFDDEQGGIMWLGHVINSLSGTIGHHRIIVDYDKLMQNPEREITRISLNLQLPVDPVRLEIFKSEFLDPRLRHTVYSLNDLLPGEMASTLIPEVYQTMEDLATAEQPNDEGLREKLSEWEGELLHFNCGLAWADKIFNQKTMAEQAVHERELKMELQHQQIASLEKLILQRDEELGQKDIELNQTGTALSRQNELTDRQNEMINQQNEVMGHQNEVIALKNAAIDQQNGIIQHEQEENNRNRETLERLTRELREQTAELNNKQMELLTIRKSLAFKISSALLLPGLTRQIRNLANSVRARVYFLKSKKLIDQSGLFDEAYYLENNPDVKVAGISPLKHYFFHGWKEGRNAGEAFDTKYYLSFYRDVQKTGINPLAHYVLFGRNEGRSPSAYPVARDISAAEGTDNPGIFVEDPDKKYQEWLENNSPGKTGLMQQRQSSENLKNPLLVTVVVISLGDQKKLKMTMNSIFAQSYVHWQCLLLSDIQAYHSIIDDPAVTALLDNPSGKIHHIATLADTVAFLDGQKGFVGFLEEGEILMQQCFWKIIREGDSKPDLVYCDHDVIDENNQHHDPWFTFNWSPYLLLSQNYIGGYYLISNEYFCKNVNILERDATFLNSIAGSSAWRFGLLLELTSRASRIQRIPEVLWSGPEKSENVKEACARSEADEVCNFLEKQGIRARVRQVGDGLIRHVQRELDKQPMVSIIIPTTGNMTYLKGCLDSLTGKTSYPNFEIILLDNGRGTFPEGITYARDMGIKVVEVNESFNWSRLNNIGAEHSGGEMLLFLNDDTEVIDSEWLTEMVRVAVQDGVGVVGSLLLYPDGKIQHAGVFLVDHGGGARHFFHRQIPNGNNYHDLDLCEREVSANTGACFMITREKFVKLGRFNEDLSLVGNDIDLCFRALQAGFRNIWTPHSKMVHHESVSRREKPIEKDESAMWVLWGSLFREGDHYYNPNLTLSREDCSMNMEKREIPGSLIRRAATSAINIVRGNQDVAKAATVNTFGVNLVAYIRAEMGVGEASRGDAKAFQAANIPFGIINYEKGNPAKMGNLQFQHLEMQKPIYDITLLHINADHTPGVIQDLGKKFFQEKYVIGYWVWELPEFPERWWNAFDLVDEIWVPSQFIYDALSIISPVPVIIIPHVVEVATSAADLERISRNSLSIPEKAFVFLSMFDVNSIEQRKNPYGSITAFKNAFSSEDREVLLIIKVNNSGNASIQEIFDFIGDYKNILVIDKVFSRGETNALISISDCFVSLHRSEGYGFCPAEAMALGKVAMLTNWSGNTQYMTSGNCIPISYELKQLGRNYGPYEAHQYWAEPDLDQATAEMKRLLKHPEIVKKTGEEAQKTIAENLSASKIGSLMNQRLRVIERKINSSKK